MWKKRKEVRISKKNLIEVSSGNKSAVNRRMFGYKICWKRRLVIKDMFSFSLKHGTKEKFRVLMRNPDSVLQILCWNNLTLSNRKLSGDWVIRGLIWDTRVTYELLMGTQNLVSLSHAGGKTKWSALSIHYWDKAWVHLSFFLRADLFPKVI